MSENIQCNGCTFCCENIGAVLNSKYKAKWAEKFLLEFPYKANENGACEMLKDNKCSIYENRPIICNVKKSFDYQNVTNSKEEWLNMNTKICRKVKNNSTASLELGEKIVFAINLSFILFFFGRKILRSLKRY